MSRNKKNGSYNIVSKVAPREGRVSRNLELGQSQLSLQVAPREGLVSIVSKTLTKEYGKGSSRSILLNMRAIYLSY